MNFSVTQNGIVLDSDKYNWDESTKVFSTEENDLVLDFSDIDGVVFKTGSGCKFITGSYCTFDTGDNCKFNTDYDCTFVTGAYCTFKTSSYCTFKTESNCIFNTDSCCKFITGSNCTFDTGDKCTIRTFFNSRIKMKESCVVHRVDTDEVWMFSNCMIQTNEENESG